MFQNWKKITGRMCDRAKAWSKYNLTLGGRINICKTMIISVAVYNATIYRPDKDSLKKMNKVIMGNTKAATEVIDPWGFGIEPGPELYNKLIRNMAQTLVNCLK